MPKPWTLVGVNGDKIVVFDPEGMVSHYWWYSME